MKIKNELYIKNIIVGIVLLTACTYAILKNSIQIKYLIAIIIAGSVIIGNLIRLITNKNLTKNIDEVDERDAYNAMKSCQQTLKFTNDACFILADIFITIYVFTKNYLYLTIGITLVSVIILILLVILLCNCYYEKHN